MNHNPRKDTSYNCMKCGERFHNGQTLDGQNELCAQCELIEVESYLLSIEQQEPIESAEF